MHRAGCCLNGPGGVPPEIDCISVDDYAGTLLPSGTPEPNSTCPHPPLDARCQCWGVPPAQEATCNTEYLRATVVTILTSTPTSGSLWPGVFGEPAGTKERQTEC